MPFLIMLIMVVAVLSCWFWLDSSYDAGITPLVVAALVFVLGCGALWHDYAGATTRTVIVEGKDRGGEDGSYRVYTNGDTLAIKDMHMPPFAWRTNSADVYGDIPVCHKLVIEVRGWEFGFLSLMPNIDNIVEDLGPVEDCVTQ
jgi:hypothetical protein